MLAGSVRLAVTAVLLLVIASCGGGDSTGSNVDTIRAAVPEKSPPAPALSTVGDRPIVTTSGSPRPTVNVVRDFERIVLRDGSIEARKLIPRVKTAFHVTNEGSVPHAIAFPEISPEPLATIAPGESVVVQAYLTRSPVRVVCLIEGHRESTSIETYLPR